MSIVMRSAVPALLAAAVLAPAPASAQDGVIAGRVVDTAGEALPGGTVLAVGSTPGEPRREVTDLDGRYRIADLSPATYTVVFTLPGFRTVARVVHVGTGLSVTVDAVMVVGADGDYPGLPSDPRAFPRLPSDQRAFPLLPSGPRQTGPAALECEFRPDGVITECRRVFVAGRLLPLGHAAVAGPEWKNAAVQLVGK